MARQQSASDARDSRGSVLNAEAKVIAGGVGEVLLDAEVAFGGLDGGMAE